MAGLFSLAMSSENKENNVGRQPVNYRLGPNIWAKKSLCNLNFCFDFYMIQINGIIFFFTVCFINQTALSAVCQMSELKVSI